MPSTLFRGCWKIVVAIIVMVFMLLPGAPSASAHDQLISTNPANNSQLETAPSKLTLTFSAKLLKLGNELVLADAHGGNRSLGASALDGDTMTQAIEPGLPKGQYEARWRVISSDGHPISGSFRFAIGEPVDSDSSMPPVSQKATPTENQGPTPAVAAEPPQQSNSWWTQPWLLWSSIGAAVGLLGYLIYLAADNARKNTN